MASRGAGYGRNSMHLTGGATLGGTSRRTTMVRGASTMGASRGGTGGNALIGYIKDDRRLSDKSVQREYTERIRKRLIDLNFNVVKLKRSFSEAIFNPSQAEFFSIVEYIFATSWSPGFRLDKFSDKTEGVLCIARLLKYPFMLNKSFISSLTPHNMPSIIGFVGWLAGLSELDEVSGVGPDTSALHSQTGDESSELNDIWQNYLTGSFRYERDPAKTAEIVRGFEDKLQQIVGSTEAEAARLEGLSERSKMEVNEMLKKIDDTNAEREGFVDKTNGIKAKADELVSSIDELKAHVHSLEEAAGQKALEHEQRASALKVVSDRKAFLSTSAEERHITESDRKNLILERQQATEQWNEANVALEARVREAGEKCSAVDRLTAGVGQKVHIYRLRRAASFPTAAAAAASEEDVEDKVLSSFESARKEQFSQDLSKIVRKGAKREHASLERKSAELAEAIAAGEEQLKSLSGAVAAGRETLAKLKSELDACEAEISVLQSKAQKEAQKDASVVNGIRTALNERKERAAVEFEAANNLMIEAAERERREMEAMNNERRKITNAIFSATKALLDHKESILKALEVLEDDSRQALENCKRLELQQQQQQQQQRRRSLPPSAKKQKL